MIPVLEDSVLSLSLSLVVCIHLIFNHKRVGCRCQESYQYLVMSIYCFPSQLVISVPAGINVFTNLEGVENRFSFPELILVVEQVEENTDVIVNDDENDDEDDNDEDEDDKDDEDEEIQFPPPPKRK
ncbi:hypothetical protein O6P43_032157 [Quillaja saponaria]|uniref:Uncharacterized protein n=1 Tax=Quillaja saponaria TaxID=32244 RepID=A0AAD7KY99_QUISA|nr:hypothetical protein O6P43_032157 [Quillaja saponaria]